MKKVVIEDKKCCLSWYAYYLLLYRTEYLNVKKCSFQMYDYMVRAQNTNDDLYRTDNMKFKFNTTIFFVVYTLFEKMQTHAQNTCVPMHIQSNIKKIKIDWFQLIPNYVPMESFLEFQTLKQNICKPKQEKHMMLNQIVFGSLIKKNYHDNTYNSSIHHWIGLCENFTCFRMNSNIMDIQFGDVFNQEDKLKAMYKWLSQCIVNSDRCDSRAGIYDYNSSSVIFQAKNKCSDFSKKQYIQQLKNHFTKTCFNVITQIIYSQNKTLKKSTWEDVCLKSDEMDMWLKSIFVSRSMNKIRMRNVTDFYMHEVDDFWNQPHMNQTLKTIDICVLKSKRKYYVDKFLNKFLNVSTLKMDMYYDSKVSLKTLRSFRYHLKHLYLSNVHVNMSQTVLENKRYPNTNEHQQQGEILYNNDIALDSAHFGSNCLFEKNFDEHDNLFNQMSNTSSIFICESLEKNNHIQYCMKHFRDSEIIKKITVLRDCDKKNKF